MDFIWTFISVFFLYFQKVIAVIYIMQGMPVWNKNNNCNASFEFFIFSIYPPQMEGNVLIHTHSSCVFPPAAVSSSHWLRVEYRTLWIWMPGISPWPWLVCQHHSSELQELEVSQGLQVSSGRWNWDKDNETVEVFEKWFENDIQDVNNPYIWSIPVKRWDLKPLDLARRKKMKLGCFDHCLSFKCSLSFWNLCSVVYITKFC